MIGYWLEESGIFVVKFSETVGIEEIKKYISAFEKLSNLPDNILILYDFREALVKLKKEHIQMLNELAEKASRKYLSAKTAFIVDKPIITAIMLMFSEKTLTTKTKRKVFSTEIAAREWLKQ